MIGLKDNPPFVMQDPPLHTQFRKRLRDPQLVVLAEQNSCLLLTIA